MKRPEPMKGFRSTALVLVLVAGAVLVWPSRAHAYLDPGTGSYVLQIVIGVLLGGIFALKTFWTRIKSFAQNLLSRKSKRH
jgi:hypothetical protein